MPKRKKGGRQNLKKNRALNNRSNVDLTTENPYMTRIPEEQPTLTMSDVLHEDEDIEDVVEAVAVNEEEKDIEKSVTFHQDTREDTRVQKKMMKISTMMSDQVSESDESSSLGLNMDEIRDDVKEILQLDGCVASPRLSVRMERSVKMRANPRTKQQSQGKLSWLSASFRISDARAPAQDSDMDDEQHRPHYRITSKKKFKKQGCFSKFRSCLGCYGSNVIDAFTYDSMVGEDPMACCSFDPNRMIVSYVSWSFRTSLCVLFMTLSIAFFFIIGLFALLMMLLGRNNPTCFTPNYSELTGRYDAFALSWTTFTTVGYGHTYPAHGADEPDQEQCVWLQVLCTLEAFVGVLYASFCGAILFGKVMRIQSLAPIVFSDPITIRYGRGVSQEDVPAGKIPCPILSFRLANLHSDRAGGEVVDSLINVVGIFNESKEQEVATKNKMPDLEDGHGHGHGHGFSLMHGHGFTKAKRRKSTNSSVLQNNAKKVTISEDPGSHVNIERTFTKLDIDSPENPYFKRTWTVNHTLDENSPLLLSAVKKEIENNDGYWPGHLDSADAVRDSIKFSQIFVSVSGISVVCADSVYAQHLYNYMDMNVGYQFVPILYTSDSLDIKVDFETLNDVMEQNGGGGEMFYTEDSERSIMRNISGNQMVVTLPDDDLCKGL